METVETPQPQPKADRPLDETQTTNWPKIVLAAVVGLGLLAGSAYAGYWYGTESAKLPPEVDQPLTDKTQTPTPTPTPMPIDRAIPPPGGDCRYDTYRGVCTITSIEKTEASRRQNPITGYEGFKIQYQFEAKDTIPLKRLELVSREQILQLANSWYPGPQFIEKYEIELNRKFDCAVQLITKGTCSPVIFGFEDIDTTDYFETKQ